MLDEFINKEYSPSQWSKRMSPTEVVTAHGEVLKSSSKIYYYFPGYKIYKKLFFLKDSDLAYESDVLKFSLKLNENSTAENDEHRLEIFYKNPASFEYKNGRLNFNSRKVFVYLHGGYWVRNSLRN